jgi:hypothetical protein
MDAKELKTAEEFREFFASIPEDEWHTCSPIRKVNSCCILGHLGLNGYELNPPAERLADTLIEHFPDVDARKKSDFVWMLNDGIYGPLKNKAIYHPRANVLAALDSIIAQQKGAE